MGCRRKSDDRFLGIQSIFLQASKDDAEQPLIADSLQPFSPNRGAADVCIVGCGPAGLALAAELAKRGVSVALVGTSSGSVSRGNPAMH